MDTIECVSLITLTLFSIIYFFTTRKSKRIPASANLPPGPRKYPFIGNLNHFIGSDHPPHHAMTKLSLKYGPIIHLQLGEISMVVVSSPETAREVMKVQDLTFASRPLLVASEISGYAGNNIALAPYGDYWRQLRKICSMELLSMSRVRSFQPIRQEEVKGLCRYIASKEKSPICIREKLLSAHYDIVTLSIFGRKTKEHTTLISFFKEMTRIVAGLHIAEVYPSIQFLRHIGGYKTNIQNSFRNISFILDKIIEQHRLNICSGQKNNMDHENLLDVLLKLQESNYEEPLATESIKAVLIDLFAGGVETISTVIDWAMSELIRNPRVLKIAQDEVRHVFDSKPEINENCFDQLHYLKLVMKETMRLHPSGPLLLPRESRESCEINGYHIPAKTRVLVNAWAIGRDSKYWEDAKTFKPERFQNSSVDYIGDDFLLLPFGAGRRMCPGVTFGLVNVELTLAMLLYHFDWVLPEGIKPQDVDMTEAFSGVSARKTDVSLVPILMRPLPISG